MLAAEYATTWVPEQARSYLTALGKPYDYEDLAAIAERQSRMREVRARRAKGYLFCDTDMLVLLIWSLEKYGRVDPVIEEKLKTYTPDAYILCAPDIPYEADPLRESEGQRGYLFERYRAELDKLAVPYLVVRGNLRERLAQVMEYLAKL